MEPENNTPEEQAQNQSSSNTYPGQWSNDKAQKLYNVSQAPKKIKNLKKGAKKTAKYAGKIARGSVQAVQKARQAYAAAQALYVAAGAVVSLLGWEIIIIILIIVIIIFILDQVGVLGINTYSNQQLTASGPIFAKIGDKLDYTITVNYPRSAQNIIISDQIPDGTQYINAPQGKYDFKTNTVTWNLTATTSSASATLSLTLLATKDNDYIVNLVKGIIQGGVLGINDSKLHTQLSPTIYPLSPNSTPIVFQLAPTSIPVSPQDANIIKSCVVTKIGEPEVIPSLPPECTDF